MSPSDTLKDVQKKMHEYIDGRVKSGWLIDIKNPPVEIYRQGKEVEILDSPRSLSGEDLLLNFVLDMQL
ncbi:MAG: Uma2 family endonuclease [Okeania sp. SIO3C4]|nr:Uma2 family endonuclease [Okeania sp. SIO3C4]